MSKTVQEHVTKCAEEAKEERRWMTPADHRERELFRRMAKDRKLKVPMRGMYVPMGEYLGLKPDVIALRTIRTLAEQHPNWIFCSFSAGLVQQLEVGFENAMPIHVVDMGKRPTKSTSQIVRHRADGPVRTRVVDDVTVTAPEVTAIDCMLECGFDRGLAIADSALRNQGLGQDHLKRELKMRQQSRAASVAEAAINHADPDAENGGESMARALMIRQGFMIPELQVEIPDIVEGGTCFRADYYWDLRDLKLGVVAGELDGMVKYEDPEMMGSRDVTQVLTDERQREARISASDIKVVRFKYDLLKEPDKFVELLNTYGIPRTTVPCVGI